MAVEDAEIPIAAASLKTLRAARENGNVTETENVTVNVAGTVTMIVIMTGTAVRAIIMIHVLSRGLMPGLLTIPDADVTIISKQQYGCPFFLVDGRKGQC